MFLAVIKLFETRLDFVADVLISSVITYLDILLKMDSLWHDTEQNCIVGV